LVLNYAANISDHRRQADYIELAHQIQRVYQVPPLLKLLEKNARLFSGGPWLQKLLRDAGKAYSSEDNAENHYAATAKLLADLRDALPKIRNLRVRLRIMDLSLAVEAVNFSNSTQLRNTKEKISRQKRLFWLKNSAIAAYGTGHINQRSLDAILTSINQLKHDQITLDTYLKELNYLARVPGWSMQGLRFQFYQSMIKLAEIEPKANLFIQDILRGSPLLFFSQNLDILSRDGNQSAGVTHKVFDQQVAIGFHALNPGLVRGTLHTQVDIHDLEAFDPKGIYLLPETISELPPIAGIITVGEGNPLSHVQLLARNLGIPNVTINENILEQLQKHDSKTIIMAVSPNGLVELNNDSGQWEEFFNTTTKQMDVVIKPNLEKLNLKIRDIIDLGSLRATDSGRIVGPKAAKLGELHFHYPGKVAKAVAIPFGFFRAAVLDKPYKNTTQTIFEWMVRQYKILHLLDEGSDLRIQATESFRTQAHEIISNTDIGDHYRNELRKSIIKTFGSSDIGVFIRSDTNVEDLPGFTGAGLNLTLFNIVGIDNIFEGLGKVWASPFTTRAFAWRQSLMETPQHVYPAILLMQTVPNAKSGVMVTEDIDSGDKNILSVAVNEGVGGAVDGQSAESLRINIDDGSVRLLATATARFRKVPSAKGGIMKLPVSGSETILTSDEIKQLIQFSKQLPTTFPPIIDDMGNPAPADIEFGFYNGKLQLFQLRPFLQSRKAQNNTYLISMDQALKNNKERMVIMSEELE
ncbi:MAG: PEP/pyruvate-binding domain-containing protein, partial [Methylococcaceae bacterium]